MAKPAFTRPWTRRGERPRGCALPHGEIRISTGVLVFFDSRAGIDAQISLVILLPKPPPVYIADDHDVARIDADPLGHGRDRLHRALRRAVHIELAVLPVGHRAPRLERLVAHVGCDEGFVEHQRGVLESAIDVAVRPLVGPACPLAVVRPRPRQNLPRSISSRR